MNKLLTWLISRFTGGSARSVLLKRNMLYALLIKAGSICCTLVLVPATIDFVNPTQYAIWLTISSIVAWMSFFDIGFSNGLRNKLVEALARGDIAQGKSFVSTTYYMLTLIFSGVALLTIPLVWCFDISPLLDIDLHYEEDLKWALTIVILYFCISFVLRTLSYVLMADQRNSYSSFIEFIGQFSVLAVIFSIRNDLEGSLTTLALAQCIPPLLVWVVASIYHYTHRYRNICPALQDVHLSDTRLLMSLGVKFFIIQIATIIQFHAANFLIARLYSIEEVTDYNIAYRYFNILYMCFFLLLQPFWSAVTDAYTQNDIAWIRRSIRKYMYIAFGALAGGILMLLLSPYVYDLWIGDRVHIDFTLSFWMMCYFMVIIFGAVFCFFVNGIGALRIQYVSSLISPIIFIAMVLLLSKVYGVGMHAILIASIIANYNGLILAPLQYYMVIHRKKKGIWTM